MTEQEEIYAFYYQVGKSLERWAWIETELAMICGFCSSVRHHGYSHITGFFVIENFRSKLAYTDALVNVKCRREQPKVLHLWSIVKKRIEKMATLRNQLAHRRATVIRRGKPGERIALMEPNWILNDETDATKLPPEQKITIRDVAHRSAQFSALYSHLCDFSRLLSVGGDQLPPMPTVKRPTMREIESVMREAMGRQQRPAR